MSNKQKRKGLYSLSLVSYVIFLAITAFTDHIIGAFIAANVSFISFIVADYYKGKK